MCASFKRGQNLTDSLEHTFHPDAMVSEKNYFYFPHHLLLPINFKGTININKIVCAMKIQCKIHWNKNVTKDTKD